MFLTKCLMLLALCRSAIGARTRRNVRDDSRRNITNTLTIEANDFSVESVAMETVSSDGAMEELIGDDCSQTSKDIRAMYLLGAEKWQGVYKCLNRGQPVLVQCGLEDGCPSEQCACGASQAACCSVKSKPDEMSRALLSAWDFIDSTFDAAEAAAKAVTHLVMPAEPAVAEMDRALSNLQKNVELVGGDLAIVEKLKRELTARWSDLTGFEKSLSLAMMKAANPGTELAERGSSLLEAAKKDVEKPSIIQILVAIFYALIKSCEGNGRRASHNMGWEYVWTNMRAEGYRV